MIQLEGKVHDLGGGFIVRRILPQRTKRMVGPFTFLDHMGPVTTQPNQNTDVRPHPHIGLSTLTYLFEGRSVHRDSLGEHVVITPGDVNLMTSGNGIVHSERSHEDDRTISHTMHGLQFWIALPDHLEDCEPKFQNCPKDKIPFDENSDRKISIVVGTAFGKKSPVEQSSPSLFLEIHAKKDFIFENPCSDFELGIYVISGSLEYNSTLVTHHQMLIFEPHELKQIKISKDSHVAVVGGQAFQTPRHMWWNFVSSSKEKIEMAKKKWKERQFPEVPGETEFIPLPES